MFGHSGGGGGGCKSTEMDHSLVESSVWLGYRGNVVD